VHDLAMTDYTLHSIGLLLFNRNRHRAFNLFVQDVVLNGNVRVVSLSANQMKSVGEISRRYKLDFDDAYQYVAADVYRLTLVSFDSDFDVTRIEYVDSFTSTPQKAISYTKSERQTGRRP
jgi:hypothetical protein